MRMYSVVCCALMSVISICSSSVGQVRINEFLANNVSVNPDICDYDDFSDWVELYNDGSSEAEIGGYYLTGDINQPTKWKIPAGTVIPPKGYLLIWCDGNNAKPGTSGTRPWYGGGNFKTKRYHASFKLNKSGEQVVLFDGSGGIVDSTTFPKQYADVSMGRTSEGLWGFFDNPTPGAANSTAAKQSTQIASTVVFSVSGGFYSSAQSVTLSSPDGNDIYYTTDCSIPHEDDTKYTGPIQINKSTVVRARSIPADKFAGRVVTNTYFINEDLHKLMVVAINSEPDFWFGDTIGIYENSAKGREIPASIEFFTTDGHQVVKADAGIRLGSLTNYGVDQKPLQIALRNRYGDRFVNYQFYAKPITKFDRFRLRDGGDAYSSSLINDALLDPICNGQAEVGYQAFRLVVVYINGEFWGIQDLREQFKDMYFSENYGLAEPEKRDEVRTNLVGTGMMASEGMELVNGTWDTRKAIVSLVKSEPTMSDTKYGEVRELVDIESLSDFFIMISFAKAISWGHNQDMWKAADGKWRWLVTDFDRGFVYEDLYTQIGHNLFTTAAGTSPKLSNDTLLSPLLTNDEFRNYFVQRYAAHLNSTFKPSRLVAIVDSIADIYELEIEGHVAKWNSDGVKSVNAWKSEIEKIRDFMNDRPPYIWEHLSGAPFNAGGRADLTVTFSPSNAQADIFICGVPMSQGVSDISMYKNIPFKVKAVGKPGWRCSGWEGGDLSDSITVTLSADETITANFSTVSVDKDGTVLHVQNGVRERVTHLNGEIVVSVDCSFSVKERICVDFFNVAGQRIKKSMSEMVNAGDGRVIFRSGQQASGIYYYRIRAGRYIKTGIVSVQ